MLGGVKSKKKLIDIDCKSITDKDECNEKKEYCTWNSNNKCQQARDKDATDVREARVRSSDGRTREGKVRNAVLQGIKSRHRPSANDSSMRPQHRPISNASSMRPQFLKTPSMGDSSSTTTSDWHPNAKQSVQDGYEDWKKARQNAKPSMSDDLSSEIHDFHKKHKKIIGPRHKAFFMPESRTAHLSTHDLEHGHNQFVKRRARKNLGKLRTVGTSLGRMRHQSNLSRPTLAHGHMSRRDLMSGRERLTTPWDAIPKWQSHYNQNERPTTYSDSVDSSDLEEGRGRFDHRPERRPSHPSPAFSDTSSIFSHGPVHEAPYLPRPGLHHIERPSPSSTRRHPDPFSSPSDDTSIDSDWMRSAGRTRDDIERGIHRRWDS
jgi:hypothetical protein